MTMGGGWFEHCSHVTYRKKKKKKKKNRLFPGDCMTSPPHRLCSGGHEFPPDHRSPPGRHLQQTQTPRMGKAITSECRKPGKSCGLRLPGSSTNATGSQTVDWTPDCDQSRPGKQNEHQGRCGNTRRITKKKKSFQFAGPLPSAASCPSGAFPGLLRRRRPKRSCHQVPDHPMP